MINFVQILYTLSWHSTIFSLIALLYYAYKIQRRYQRFKKYGIKGPSPIFLCGNIFELESKPRHEILHDWFERYGETFCFHLPIRSTIVTEDLDFIKHILSDTKVFGGRPFPNIHFYPLMDSVLQTNGKSWSNSRKTVSPILSTSKVSSSPVADILDGCVERFLDNLNSTGTHEPFKRDITCLCNRYSFDVILKTSLGIEMDVYSDDNELIHAMDTFFKNASIGATKVVQCIPFLSFPMKLMAEYITSGKMIDIILLHLKKTVREYLANKSGSGSNAVILQSMLQHLRDGNITEHELLGNSLLMLLAGYETTANGLIFVLYVLAKYPEIQEKVRYHVNEDGYKHPYVEMVWLETLRIYPPVIGMVSREANKDVVINGITIEKYTTVMADLWRIHHSPKYWPDPWKFDPTRFDRENRSKIVPCSYMPYGYGQRICLGMNLATAEACRLVAKIVSRYQISFSDDTPDSLPIGSVVPELTKPSRSIYLKFQKIKDL
ncbi:cytochrome P450 3A8-like [Brevipalpus obovatus]|uniref:cytochrome P450 3A8-like n=1 Tax=Brevipalpus obovatus TaxID=246614 RepID=UPI003D9EBD2C